MRSGPGKEEPSEVGVAFTLVEKGTLSIGLNMAGMVDLEEKRLIASVLKCENSQELSRWLGWGKVAVVSYCACEKIVRPEDWVSLSLPGDLEQITFILLKCFKIHLYRGDGGSSLLWQLLWGLVRRRLWKHSAPCVTCNVHSFQGGWLFALDFVRFSYVKLNIVFHWRNRCVF